MGLPCIFMNTDEADSTDDLTGMCDSTETNLG